MAERSQLVNALVGAAVSVVLFFLPFSSLLGGGVAGYLEGGEVGDGARVGALAGLLALVPLVLFLALFGGFFMVALLGTGPRGMFGVGFAFLLVAFAFVLVYVVGFSALGGVVGAVVRGDEDGDPGTGG